MSFRDSDDPFTEVEGVHYPKHQKISDFDYPKYPRKLQPSTTATPLWDKLQPYHLSHLEAHPVSGKSGSVIPSTSSFGVPESPPTPVVVKTITAKSVSPNNRMGLIDSTVFREIERSGTVAVNLHIDWNLLDFMKTQYHDNGNAKLGSVITLSGTVLHAQATTCSEYAQKTWPAQGSNVVMAFQTAIDSSLRKAQGPRSQPFLVSMLFYVLC